MQTPKHPVRSRVAEKLLKTLPERLKAGREEAAFFRKHGHYPDIKYIREGSDK